MLQPKLCHHAMLDRAQITALLLIAAQCWLQRVLYLTSAILAQ